MKYVVYNKVCVHTKNVAVHLMKKIVNNPTDMRYVITGSLHTVKLVFVSWTTMCYVILSKFYFCQNMNNHLIATPRHKLVNQKTYHVVL